MDAIVIKKLKSTQEALKIDRNVVLEVKPELMEKLADLGYDPR